MSQALAQRRPSPQLARAWANSFALPARWADGTVPQPIAAFRVLTAASDATRIPGGLARHRTGTRGGALRIESLSVIPGNHRHYHRVGPDFLMGGLVLSRRVDFTTVRPLV